MTIATISKLVCRAAARGWVRRYALRTTPSPKLQDYIQRYLSITIKDTLGGHEE